VPGDETPLLPPPPPPLQDRTKEARGQFDLVRGCVIGDIVQIDAPTKSLKKKVGLQHRPSSVRHCTSPITRCHIHCSVVSGRRRSSTR